MNPPRHDLSTMIPIHTCAGASGRTGIPGSWSGAGLPVPDNDKQRTGERLPLRARNGRRLCRSSLPFSLVSRAEKLIIAVAVAAWVLFWGQVTHAPAQTDSAGSPPGNGDAAETAQPSTTQPPPPPQSGASDIKVKKDQQEQDSKTVQPRPRDRRVGAWVPADRTRIKRSAKQYDQNMRKLDSTIREMNTTIQRLRTLNRRR
jgi:hypothetical protein